MPVKAKPGRKTDLERTLIKIATLARQFGAAFEELSAHSALVEAEITLIDRTLRNLEISHGGLVILYEVELGQKTDLERLAVKMVMFAHDLERSRTKRNTWLAALRAEMAVIEQSINSLKAHHDYFRLRFEAKQEGRL